jgi:hypothetical protein
MTDVSALSPSRRGIVRAVAGIAVVAGLAGSFFLGVASAPAGSTAAPRDGARYVLVIDEDADGTLRVGSFDSSVDVARSSPDDPRRFLDPIPSNCSEALAGIDAIRDEYATEDELPASARPLLDRHVVIAQHTCTFENYTRYLVGGFDRWLYDTVAVAGAPAAPAAADDADDAELDAGTDPGSDPGSDSGSVPVSDSAPDGDGDGASGSGSGAGAGVPSTDADSGAASPSGGEQELAP